MNIFHTDLSLHWNELTIFEQMANIGAEVGRYIRWNKKGNQKMSRNSFYRALELIDFTVDDPKNKNSLKEILRMRELLVDYCAGDNIYKSTDEAWERYFYYFNLAARKK